MPWRTALSALNITIAEAPPGAARETHVPRRRAPLDVEEERGAVLWRPAQVPASLGSPATVEAEGVEALWPSGSETGARPRASEPTGPARSELEAGLKTVGSAGAASGPAIGAGAAADGQEGIKPTLHLLVPSEKVRWGDWGFGQPDRYMEIGCTIDSIRPVVV
jgi:hypothetical protein